jgi:RNA-splicing ligase RtcB
MESNEMSLNQQMLKQALKEALVETFHEERDFLYEVIADVMQDLAFAEAIQEGRKTEFVSREDIFNLLESAS